MSEKIKILLCGDVEGNFNTLFKRTENIINKSGPFDLMLCVGNFFGNDDKEIIPYRNGTKKVPVLTYILGPNNEETSKFYSESDAEICPNVYDIGKRGVYTSTGGLKIAYISGTASDGAANNEWNFTTDDLKDLKDLCFRSNSNFRGVDILLSSQWPANVNQYDKNFKAKINSGSDKISWLAVQLKPRYHISGLEGFHYERSPYRTTDADNLEIVTRFIGLGKVGNALKQKWIHALSLTPISKMSIAELIQKTVDETPCPYNIAELDAKVLNKKRVSERGQYFFDMNSTSEVVKSKKRQRIEFDQSKCWFCLASPAVQKHLIITVGDSVYIALAKGGIVDEHFLICPIEHGQCSVSQTKEVLAEVEKFKEVIRKFYGRNNNVPVFFERNYKSSHMQIQSIPIPKSVQSKLLDAFNMEAERNELSLEEMDSHSHMSQVIPKGALYFLVELPTGETLYTKIVALNGFPMNFGRQVLASSSILNKPDRIEWKDCISKMEDEVELVKKIRTDFKSYDK